MDRFIVIPHLQLITFYICLKSNMDRFIGTYARAVKVFYRV